MTIATNMAGRGVDIKIDDTVRELGGLYVLGTERHEARRIDNQLRGRSGRQGDPGETRFYLSGQDDLVRLFAGDRIYNIMERFKLPDDQPMEAKILSNQIESAQKKVEEQNFVARKNVLKYDDVMNVQRQVIYEQRRRVLEGQDLSEEIKEEWLPEVISNVVAEYTAASSRTSGTSTGSSPRWSALYGTGVTAEELAGLDREAIIDGVPRRRARRLRRARDARSRASRKGLMRDLERFMVLQVVDTRWREHLESMDYMREGIHLRGMAQKDPLVEYRNEGHLMFLELNRVIREEVIALLYHAQVEPSPGGRRGGRRGGRAQAPAAQRRQRQPQLRAPVARRRRGDRRRGPARRPRRRSAGGGSVATRPVVKSEHENIGRNDPCWCGSGKKFKRCHGA